MKTWTPDASAHFESWLGRVRHSVAGDPAVDADDIAQDLRAHVHAELEALPEPVTIGALDRVLEGLGNPAQWTDAARPARAARSGAWRHVSVTAAVAQSQKALAGDWGMPILLAFLTLAALPVIDEGGVFVLAVTYFIARSQVVYAPHRLEGRQRWLAYLPLAIGAGLLAGAVLAFPVFVSDGAFRVRGGAEKVLWAVGAWWMILGFLAAREPKRVQAALRPFADRFEPTHGRFLMMLGAALLITATVILMV